MSKILITNAYSWYNKGDAAIVIGMLYALRKYIPDAEITILSHTPDIDRAEYQRYDTDIQVFRYLLVPYRDYSKKLASAVNYLLNVIKYTLLLKLQRVKTLTDDALRAYANADVVISSGGGYIGGYRLGNLGPLYGIHLAKMLGKTVIIWAQSIEPFTNIIVEKTTRHVLNEVDLIITREELSVDYLKKLGVRPPVYSGADSAFLTPGLPIEEGDRLLTRANVHRQTGDFLVGVTARLWYFPQCRGNERKREVNNYFAVMVNTIKYLISELNARVIFYPLVIFSPSNDDRIISREIADVVDSDRVTVLTEDYSPEQLKAMIGYMDLFIGTRMHSNIFSTSMYIPTIAISYEKKTDGIMTMLGLQDYVLDINTLKLEDMIGKIESTLANKTKIKEMLPQTVNRVKKLALSSAELVQQFITTL